MTLHFYRTPDSTRLRALLKRLGLGQREAARGLGISERDIRYMCAGSIEVPAVVFLALEKLIEDENAPDR